MFDFCSKLKKKKGIKCLKSNKAKHYTVILKAGMWKRKLLNFCGSGNVLKKEAGSGSKLGSI